MPTIVPNTADAYNFGSDTTPTLEFTGSDEDGDDLTYEVEISDQSDFYPVSPEIRSSSQNSASSGSPSISEPAGAQVGDKIIVVVSVNGQTTIDDNNGSTPFTEDINDYKPNTSSGNTVSVFSRIKQSGDPTTYNFTPGTTGRWSAVAICLKGGGYDVAPSTGNAANDDTSSTGTINAPSITVGNNSLHIVVCTWDTASIGTITTPSGYTLIQNANGGGEPLHASYKAFATGGATGAVTCQNTEFGAMIAFSFSVKSNTTVLLDKLSASDSGFANTVSGGDTDPFNSGEKISFTVQAGDALSYGTYYWRARVKDPSGTNTWSSWTTARSFTISSSTSVSVSDTASGNDATQSIHNSIVSAETTSGSDVLSALVAKIPLTDTSSGTDGISGSLVAIVPQTDSGIAVEIDAVSVVLSTIADTLSGVDAAGLISVIAEMDNFSGSDIVNVVETANQVSVSENGSASELLGIIAICRILEDCAGAENLSILVNTQVLDVSGGSDSVFQSAKIPTVDTATGADIAKIVASMNIIEFASGYEVLLLAVAISQMDPCVAADTIAILNRLAMLDSAIGNEQEYIAGKMLLSETGGGNDIAQLITYVFSSDSAEGAENIVKTWKKIYTKVSGKYDTITKKYIRILGKYNTAEVKYAKIDSPYSPKI